MPTHEIRAQWEEQTRSCIALAVLETDGWTEYNVCVLNDSPVTEEDLVTSAWEFRNSQKGE